MTIRLLFAFIALSVSFGIRVHAAEIAFEPNSALPIVYVNVAIKAGYVTDPAGQSGLTNIMGEMLLRGTKTRVKEQIDLALDQMGARLEVETRAESVILRGAVLSSQLEPFLSLVDEILTQPVFPEDEIRKLKSEIISGIEEELGRDPSLASRRFIKFLFLDHPYGKPVLGTINDVRNLTRPAILGHYERLVRDPYILVVGTGNASEERIVRWTEALASKRKVSDAEALPKITRPTEAPQRRVLLVDKPERTQTQINIGQIGIKMTDDDFFPLYLGNYAFGGGSFLSRLMTEIRSKRGWSYGANSGFRFGTQPRSWLTHLFPASKDSPAALEFTLKMIQDLKERGLSAEEFAFAKRSIVNGAGFMYDTPKKRVENKLLERTLDLPDGFMQSYAAKIDKVSLEQVNSSLKDYLRPDRLAITVLGTAKNLKEPIARAAGVPIEKVEVVPYTQE